jgi:glycosyltransferase involved in cell wall biosynthesis
MNVIHFINALENGGAEKILYDTIAGLNGEFNHTVVVISKRGSYVAKLIDHKIKVETISLMLFMRLMLGNRKNTIVHSYLYRSHLLSILFKLAGYSVIWSIHSSFVNKPKFIVKIVGLFSHFIPKKIVFVSKYAQEQHSNFGYSIKKSMVIYNGIDVDKFNDGKGCDINLGKQDCKKICMVSRFHQVKDYPRFFSIASRLIHYHPKSHFYLIGKGNNNENSLLTELLNRYSLAKHVTLLGEVSDISKIYPCFDLLVSTSQSESFGLTILEAISSGLNVSTINLPVLNELLGEYTTNEAIDDDSEIALRWLDKAGTPPPEISKKFIEDNYSLESMTRSFSCLYKDTIQ